MTTFDEKFTEAQVMTDILKSIMEVPAPTRKPIAVTSSPSTDDSEAFIVVVCNDGTIWMMPGEQNTWSLMPGIPQE